MSSAVRKEAPLGLLLSALALVHSALLFGHQPVGSDADLMYRPFKAELARSLGRGTLPFWSDRLGLGVPLIAESHVAALYPPNLVTYRFLSVDAAYRLLAWLSYLALGAATYAYARVLGVEPWGAALAGLTFALCGFQANHAVHEWAVNAVPFLPLNLALADRVVRTGRARWSAGLALGIGAQLAVGHFQTQWFTLALIVVTGVARVVSDRLPGRRCVALGAALLWGLAVAAVTLTATAEMVWFTGFRRDPALIGDYALQPAQYAQAAFPRLFSGFRDGPVDPFWWDARTNGLESCFYLGAVPLALAVVGLLARPRDAGLTVWKWVAAVALVLASLPLIWPSGFALLAQLPGFGSFRCPARYTLPASLALALLAGSGFDRAVAERDFRVGLRLTALFALFAFVWGVAWSSQSGVAARLFPGAVPRALLSGSLTWACAFGALIAWRRGRVGPWLPLAVACLELGPLFYESATEWGWEGSPPTSSPTFARLARETRVGLVASPLFDLPAAAGFTPAFPYTGITAPEPNAALEPAAREAPGMPTLARRYGVTHGITEGGRSTPGAETLRLGPDPWLDRLVLGGQRQGAWRLVRYPGAFPPARAARTALVFTDPAALGSALRDRGRGPETVHYRAGDEPPGALAARSARVLAWDGREALVEHDGPCDLVLNRAFYPGWRARVGDGPERPVARADGGLQAVRLSGAGLTRVRVRYEPAWLKAAAAVALGATAAAVVVVAAGFRPRLKAA